MGIYIKGMKMPMYWYECPFCCDGYCFMISSGNDSICLVDSEKDTHRNENCPLVELPPHGDLISREWLVDISLHLMNIAKNDDIANGVKWLWQYVIEAPTIIEAEGGGI